MYPNPVIQPQAVEMVVVIQCGGGYKDQVHALERNLTPYRQSLAYRPALTLMVKKTATRWRRIPFDILIITQASKKNPRCLRNKKHHYCNHTSPQLASLLSYLNPDPPSNLTT